MCACLVAQSYPTLCDFIYCSPPGFSVYGILQVRTLECPLPGDLPDPGIKSGPFANSFFTVWATRESKIIITIINIYAYNSFILTITPKVDITIPWKLRQRVCLGTCLIFPLCSPESAGCSGVNTAGKFTVVSGLRIFR